MPVVIFPVFVLCHHDRADTERGRCGSLRHTEPIPQCFHGAYLERVERVHDEPRSLSHVTCSLDKPAISSRAPVAYWLGEVPGLGRWDTGEFDNHVGIEFLEALLYVPVEGGKVEELGEPARTGGVEVVDRDAEAGPDVERGGAEEVKDEGPDGRVTRFGDGGE